MATLQERFDAYVKRRVKQLVELGWSDSLIIQQFEAGVPKKQILSTIADTEKSSGPSAVA